MTGTVFAVASGKGGVGKTTTAINLGAMLAAAGHGVIVVDTDLGMANVGGSLDFEMDGATLHEVLSDDATVEEAIYHAPGDIDVLPSSTDIYTFAQSQTAQLQRVVAELGEEYEYVLLDTGAGISYDTILPLSLADDVLLVTTPDVASVRDTAKTAELTSRVEGTVRGAVLTQRGNDILNADNVEGTLDTDVLTVVPDDETVPMGIDVGQPLAAFSPNSPAATAYRELSNILIGETDTPELSGEPNTSASNVPSLADAEFELGTPEESLGSDSSPEPNPEEHTNVEPEPTTSHSVTSASDAETEFLSFDSTPDSASAPEAELEREPESEPETKPEAETASSETPSPRTEPPKSGPDAVSSPEDETPGSASDPVHELIDRRVIKTGDDADDSEPSVEPAPLETDVSSADDADSPDDLSLEPDIPADDADVPEPTADTATPPDESVTERDDADEFDTVLSDHADPSAESTSGEFTDSSDDLPDEIVEAEPDDAADAGGVEVVPFQDEPVRPDVGSDGNDDEDDGEDDDEETNGLFGRIGSLFR